MRNPVEESRTGLSYSYKRSEFIDQKDKNWEHIPNSFLYCNFNKFNSVVPLENQKEITKTKKSLQGNQLSSKTEIFRQKIK